MRVRLLHWWEIISSGYWFVPSVMTGFAGVLALFLLHIDRVYLLSEGRIGWLYSGGSEGAKTLLSTVAGSTITVASVVFSITIAALTQASAQFGPRLLRNFMRDTSNQVVLGTFVSTFLYCLLILRTIHGKFEDGQAFVPQASVTVAVLLAIASIAVLIYFIHHVSVSLQAPSVVAAVQKDLIEAMNHLAGGQNGVSVDADHAKAVEKPPAGNASKGCPIASYCDGYIQAIDYASLVKAARDANVLLRLHCRAGDYVIEGNALLAVFPADRCDADLSKRLNESFICGYHRTSEQDIEFAIHQMVEVAVRALSPGINDPFTAINCIDALGSAICRIARKGLPGPNHHDDSGTLRLIAPVSTFDGIVDASFSQIRQYGRTSVAVTLRLLEVIAECAGQIRSPDEQAVLLQQAELIYRQGQMPDAIPEERDRAEVLQRWHAAVKALSPAR